MAQIKITRPAQYADRLRQYSLYADGELIGKISANQALVVHLPAGQRRIWAKIDWAYSNILDVNLVESDKRALRIRNSMSGLRLLLAVLYATIWRKKYLILEEQTEAL